MEQSNKDLYMALPYDLSGSRTKNRFRVELLWGIDKILESFQETDFTVVFDYVCDIEMHFNDRLELYQVKSRNATKTFTVNEIITIEKDTKNSILGKLFLIRTTSPSLKMKLAIVSNVCLKEKTKMLSEIGETQLSSLEADFTDKIKNSISKELGATIADLSEGFYIYTPINLVKPENDLKGKLISEFETIKGYEPKKPNALWRLVFDTVQSKACYELPIADYDELIKKKGITKQEFSNMLDCYVDNTDLSVKKTETYIDSLPNIGDRRRLNLSLRKIVIETQNSSLLNCCEKKVVDFLLQREETTGLKNISDEIEILFNEDFGLPIEYSFYDKKAFYALIINNFAEGIYDE